MDSRFRAHWQSRIYVDPKLPAYHCGLSTICGSRSQPSVTPLPTGRALAAHWIRATESFVFAATATRLYRRSLNTWLDQSKGDTDYATSTRWEFVSFGSRVIAVAKFIKPQTIADVTDINEPAFSDLPESPMWAATVAAVRDFVVMGNIGGTDYGENYVQWSGFNNPTRWEPTDATQAGFLPLGGDGGRIQRIIGGSEGYIFRENSIHRMEYVGPPIIFSFSEFGVNRGTSAPDSVIRLDNRIFYYDDAGFYQIDARNGDFVPIGHQKVDAWIRQEAPASCRETMHAAIDPDHNLVLWAFCTDASNTTFNRILAYDYEIQRWSLIEIDVDLIALLPTTGYNLDQLDTVIVDSNSMPLGIDRGSIRVDSQLYLGGAFTLSLFDADHKLGTFSGDPLTATFATPELGNLNDGLLRFNNVRPHIDVASTSTIGVRVETRDKLTVNPEPSGPFMMDEAGDINLRGMARYIRLLIEVSGGFEHATGIELFAKTKP